MKPQAVIYDIGNVLIEWQPERYYDRVIGEDRRRAMFAEIDLQGMHELVDLGEHFTDDMPNNITAAQARGWQTHHFDGPKSCAERLVSDGLVTQDQAA
ncbi:hypothetical protein M3P21_04355 [Ruegeria sp. 2012CJ41-6]|uniref:Haloacid dehalogenase n=1 Tax=Ruegeria spongiae TaxID=2942209 RepID=A0ABT0PYU8_9RHOB|nr:hypothetical protein [Ruegeria spongiae]MCL6282755.1 hypothetical protein [Ruegeria spongiae]